ncbi:MAG TPA: isoprenylcysteine carboxylmethyltransferase family protein [Pyrinomonadaceae bacterium]|jgi:protein-S-isoprenylcysteine O-methyltransferase Ste14|nr:isoprenylcysteine carboxylmethyltransferase family protein [Pyrinomonadaceae bacterium]
MIQLNFWPTLAFVAVLISWVAFVITFVGHPKPPSPPEKKRDSSSIVGIVFQGLSYAALWIIRRQWFTPIFGSSKFSEIALALLTILLAATSVWFCAAAIRTLGRQWSLGARVVEGHKLVTEGPYSIVRNPIYTGMFGMLLATGLAVSHWIGLALAVLMFAIGTFIRVRSEERLLREMFATEFDEYSRRVAAVIPFLV